MGGLAVVGAYSGAKEIVRDGRKLIAHLRARTKGDVELVDHGLAWAFAVEAVEAKLLESGDPIADITLVSCSSLIRVDAADTYGFLVNLRVKDDMYVVTIRLDGTVASVSRTEPPALDPPEFAGMR